eukprot:CAMPEP_0176102700 /NCGR_PEP_ID=MMETSP0120_2-20121206/51516_1 /TAXON_ID=160619 /ORGANISM="Kryptoperidinium foliaceum, Strain CCMP 1326" /LENGTH=156 /DNA_ID=CAMNT_0017436765 /DNA_START=81 /DNA_END=549 /DNA_ORIENTATION=+
MRQQYVVRALGVASHNASAPAMRSNAAASTISAAMSHGALAPWRSEPLAPPAWPSRNSSCEHTGQACYGRLAETYHEVYADYLLASLRGRAGRFLRTHGLHMLDASGAAASRGDVARDAETPPGATTSRTRQASRGFVGPSFRLLLVRGAAWRGTF